MPLTACTNTMQRTVYNEYQGGRLVAVHPYYATEITYHPNGMLKQVTHARRGEQVSAGIAERIDADPNAMGRPYRIFIGGTTTFNLRGLDGALLREVELKAGAYEWVKDYIYRDGLLLASQHRTEGHQHYHLDHLGTTRMLTNRCGERVKRYELFPYGDTISAPANDTETRRFTGHQRDLGSLTNTTDDLEYMHARYYGVKMGRLLSVDPIQETKKATRRPQSWNRYAYVIGNPVKFIDPSGAILEVAGEYNQLLFFDAVTGSMPPGAAKYLKWKDKRLMIVGISAWAFSKMYGLVGHQLAYLTSSPQVFKVEIGKSALTERFFGSGFLPGKNGGGVIGIDPARFPVNRGGVSTSFAENLVHEMAHAVGTLIPGVQDRFNGLVGAAVPKPEGYALAVENEYRRSVLGLDRPQLRCWYLIEGDLMDAGPGAEIFP